MNISLNQSNTAVELPVLTVSSLTQSIKMLLEGNYRFVCVQGEISNSKMQTSGHFYFSLKDAGAQIAAVMFKGDAATLGKLPKDGDQVIVKGALNVYPPNGKYQIVVRSLEMAGLGALLLKLEQLKVKLKEKGYFDTARKKHLPKMPQRIGVVTSPTGAVIQDIVHVLSRRFSGFHLILNPVKVQGDGAAQEIAAAIDYFNRHKLVDVMIVGRGGGSLEDLWAFNEEIVADAIYRSEIPIISAVGHETDHTIADYVADVRAPTPSAAAEMVIAEKAQQLKHLHQIERSLQQTLIHAFRFNKERLQGVLKHPLFMSPYALLGPKMQRLDDFRIHLDRRIHDSISRARIKLLGLKKQNEALRPSVRIHHFREKLQMLTKNFNNVFYKVHERDKRELERIAHILQALDPRNVLAKGYSIVFSEKDSSIIKSVHSIKNAETVKLLFADGNALATIKEIISHD